MGDACENMQRLKDAPSQIPFVRRSRDESRILYEALLWPLPPCSFRKAMASKTSHGSRMSIRWSCILLLKVDVHRDVGMFLIGCRGSASDRRACRLNLHPTHRPRFLVVSTRKPPNERDAIEV